MTTAQVKFVPIRHEGQIFCRVDPCRLAQARRARRVNCVRERNCVIPPGTHGIPQSVLFYAVKTRVLWLIRLTCTVHLTKSLKNSNIQQNDENVKYRISFILHNTITTYNQDVSWPLTYSKWNTWSLKFADWTWHIRESGLDYVQTGGNVSQINSECCSRYGKSGPQGQRNH